MRMKSYVFTIIDDAGTIFKQINLTADEAVDFLLQHDETITAPAPKSVREFYGTPKKKKVEKHERIAAAMDSTRVGRGSSWGNKTCCGSNGPRHRNFCSNFKKPEKAPPKESAVEVAARRALSSEEYDELRTAMNDSQFQSGRYALTNRLSPKEVNLAIESADYDAYIEAGV